MTGEVHHGRCLCGAVRFSARLQKHEIDACHCGICRRWAGGVAISVVGEDLRFEDETELGVYRSSEWAERLFCKMCGTSIAWRLQDRGMSTIAAAAFEPPLDDWPLAVEIYIDDKPEGYAFAGEHRRLTGAEVEAMFSQEMAPRD